MRSVPIAGRWLLMVCLVAPAFAGDKKFQRFPRSEEFSKVCGVDVDRPANAMFAKQPGKGWRVFETYKKVPKGASREMAQYWYEAHGSLVQMAVADGGFMRYHEYCFDGSGKLTRLTYETRSSEGWGYATTGAVNESGRWMPASSRFFGLRTKKTIPRPPQAQQEGWVLSPKIYKRVDKLPFARLMTTPVEQKKEDAQAH